MKVMLAAVILLSAGTAMAQQEPQYSQFMFNKLPLNSAYTGGRDALSLRALYRDQWTQLDGHPRTMTLSGHSPLKNENIAVGASFVYDQLGVTKQTWVSGTYAYRFKLNEGGKQDMKLSLGINAGMLIYKSNLSELYVTDPTDPVFTENVSRVMPDIGAGIYFYGKNFYAGASVPNFIKSDLYSKDQKDNLPEGISAVRVPHIFGMAGGVIPLSKTGIVKFRPQVLTKSTIAKGYKSPFELDVNASFMFFDMVNVGATYRTTLGNKKQYNSLQLTNIESVDVMIEIWPTKQLLIGYAHDITLSDLNDYNKGTHEVILGYDFAYERKKVITPRYF
jgi:type IX secretion system PorP/SprF family membrane protein